MDRPFQHKLQQFSATPPEGVWQKVADALNNSESFEHRLLQYEEMPPATAWETIESRMDQAAPAKLIPFTTRYRKPLRYTAVACFLAVLLVTVSVSIKRTEAGTLEPENNVSVQASPTPSAEKRDHSEEASGDIATTIPKEQNPVTTTAVADRQKENTATTAATRSPKTGKAGAVYSSLNEYVFFSDGEGRTRKISKRLAAYVNCKEDDLPCKQRLKELRQRMAASAMTTDFTGVLDLLRQLQ